MSALRQCTREPSPIRLEGPSSSQRVAYELRRPEPRPRLDPGMSKRPRTTLAKSTGLFRSYKRGQNLGGIASVPHPRSFGQVRLQRPHLSIPGGAIKAFPTSPIQSYSEYLSFLTNQLDHFQKPGNPFFDVSRVMDHSVQSYFADSLHDQVEPSLQFIKLVLFRFQRHYTHCTPATTQVRLITQCSLWFMLWYCFLFACRSPDGQ